MKQLCKSRGFAGPSGCILDLSHTGPHEYGDLATAEAELRRRQAGENEDEIKRLCEVLMNIAYSGKTKSGMKEDALRALGLKK